MIVTLKKSENFVKLLKSIVQCINFPRKLFVVTEKEIDEIYQSNKFIQIKNEADDNITAREFATAIALRKSIKDLGIKNAISFHRSILRANNFSKQQGYISKIYKDYGDAYATQESRRMNSQLDFYRGSAKTLEKIRQ